MQTGVKTIRATVLRHQRVSVQGKPAIKAIVRDQAGTMLAMWRDNDAAKTLEAGRQYDLTGEVRTVHGQRLMVDPEFKLLPIAGAKNGRLKSLKSVRLIGKTRLKMPRRKRLAVAAAVAAGFFGLIGSIGASGQGGTSAPANNIVPGNGSARTGNAKTVDADKRGELQQASTQPQVQTPNDCEEKSVPYMSTTRYDPSTPAGQVNYSPQGVNGKDKICYIHGRDQEPEITHLVAPVNEVKLIGTHVAPEPGSASGQSASPTSDSQSRSGAICKDGWHSSSTGRGTCSHHGGVSRWLH